MNITQLKSDVDFLCGSTSGTYPDADKIRNFNKAYQNVATLIWESAGGWQFDDSNATTLPLAKTTLVHNQQDYTLPTTAQRLEAVMVKDSAGNFQKLKPFDIHDVTIALPEYFETPGMPLYYDLIGRSLMLYPTPSSAYCTLASGMGVYVNRDVTEFAVTAGTATTPGFATAYHPILSYSAAIEYTHDQDKRQMFVGRRAEMEEGLKRFYSKRPVETKTRIKPATKKRWQSYL